MKTPGRGQGVISWRRGGIFDVEHILCKVSRKQGNSYVWVIKTDGVAVKHDSNNLEGPELVNINVRNANNYVTFRSR